MGVCLMASAAVLAAATWVEWLLDPASWWVILQVALGLGFVIFVHELGHFLVAKACGVKCEKFYLGFDVGGLKLLSFKWGETEYGIGALPLGGYVKMLGQDDNPSAAAAEAQRARLSGDLPPEPTAGSSPRFARLRRWNRGGSNRCGRCSASDASSSPAGTPRPGRSTSNCSAPPASRISS